MRVLVVEDQPKVAGFIRKGLQEEGYAVDVVRDGEEALDYVAAYTYDLILLDILLPKKDGFEVCQMLRAKEVATPILMLTAKDVVADKVRGLNAGADDYLTKPFSFAELLARSRALLRRHHPQGSALLQIEDLQLDLLTHQARRGETSIELTTKEFSLLEYFIRNQERVVTRTSIAEHVWGLHFDTQTNLIDVYINRLRKKIDDGYSIKLIHTVRGRGYVLKKVQF